MADRGRARPRRDRAPGPDHGPVPVHRRPGAVRERRAAAVGRRGALQGLLGRQAAGHLPLLRGRREVRRVQRGRAAPLRARVPARVRARAHPHAALDVQASLGRPARRAVRARDVLRDHRAAGARAGREPGRLPAVPDAVVRAARARRIERPGADAHQAHASGCGGSRRRDSSAASCWCSSSRSRRCSPGSGCSRSGSWRGRAEGPAVRVGVHDRRRDRRRDARAVGVDRARTSRRTVSSGRLAGRTSP